MDREVVFQCKEKEEKRDYETEIQKENHLEESRITMDNSRQMNQ